MQGNILALCMTVNFDVHIFEHIPISRAPSANRTHDSSGSGRQSTFSCDFKLSEINMEYLTKITDLSLLPSRVRQASIPQKSPCSAQACDHPKGWFGRSNVMIRLNAPALRRMPDGHPMDARASVRLPLQWVAKMDSADNKIRWVDWRVGYAPAKKRGCVY